MLDSLVDLQLHVSGWIVPIPDNLGGGGEAGAVHNTAAALLLQ